MAGSTQAKILSQLGRAAVVTGATGGLGYETALALAKACSEVILIGRDDQKGRSAVEKISRCGRRETRQRPPDFGMFPRNWQVHLSNSDRQMQLAKNIIDIGLSTNNLEPMLRFWQQDVAIRFDQVLPVRRGQKQYRHDEQGSVIKLNHHAEPLPETAPSGYRELIIAREGLQKPRRMVDPDGNRVQLVPPGHDGITQLAVAMGVRSLSEHRRFYGDILGFAEQSWSGGPAFRLGDSLLLLEEDGTATVDPVRQASGWRYITLQIANIDVVHDEFLNKGVREGLAPITLGDVARISMILDPDGNWIELSRRASIVGGLS